jgi:hypothetical protein
MDDEDPPRSQGLYEQERVTAVPTLRQLEQQWLHGG